MRIDANGISVHYQVAGPDGAPWVTFSTSIAAALPLWEAQAAALAGHYRVLTYDTRGHGGTAATPPPYSMELLSDDVIALWDALGVEASHVVGLSLGGMVAAGLALDHPGRVRSVVIANSRMDAPEDFVRVWEERIALARDKGLGVLIDGTIGRWLTPQFIAAHPETVERIKAMIRACSIDGFVGAARALQKLDYLRRLGAIACPALFIAGREDAACPAEGIRDACGRVAGARYVELSPAAHLSNIEQPEAFNRAVAEFIESVG